MDDFIQGRLSGPATLRRILVHEKLSGRLSHVLYSMDTSDTRFLPYQFKPVLKLIESPCNSLLIADEVGLGKTIEAGLIWTELKARSGAQRLLVVCPSKLKLKWLRELSQRFGVRAEEASAGDVLKHLQEHRRNLSHQFALVVSYQALRPPSDWAETASMADPRVAVARLLNESAQGDPVIDLLVMDEAHYMRNPETQTFGLGELAADAASHRVFLSATPLHTSNKNLFSLLRLLDPDTFPNEQAFQGIVEANVPLVRLRDTLVSPRSTAGEAMDHVRAALQNPYLTESRMLQSLREELSKPDALNSAEQRSLLAYQAERSNLLGHAFSRTRKRDVHKAEDRVVRKVVAKTTALSEKEMNVYREITELALDFAASHNLPSGFLSVTPQRLVSSSIVAALRHWTKSPGSRLTDVDEEDSEYGPFVQFLHQRLYGRYDLNALREEDTKFHLLLGELRQYWADHPKRKVVVFSTFRPTIAYLDERLTEEGIKTICLKGGSTTPAQEVIDTFALPDGPDLLLSTEVGGEGLDIQFSAALINYDLPWNPMVVEQRIGRIDRIGQEAKQILILNLLQEGTIDERIYNRLYDRLDLFRNSVGDLEDVVGPVIHKMQRALLTHHLTQEQQFATIKEAEVAIAGEMQTKERLEESAGLFAAYGDYLLSQIQAKHDQAQWVNAEEIEHYATDFLQNYFPRCQLTGISPAERVYEIQLDIDTHADFDQFLRVNNLVGQTLICSSTPRKIRFDHKVYTKTERSVELVTQAHPLIRFFSAYARTKKLTQIAPVTLALASSDAGEATPLGIYLFNVQLWQVAGLRASERLRYDVMSVADGSVLAESTAEVLVEAAAKGGESWPGFAQEVNAEDHVAKLSALDDLASDAFIRFEQTCIDENADRARVQLTSIERYEHRHMLKLTEILQRMSDRGEGRLKAATQGRMAKLKERCELQRRTIKQKAETTAECQQLCFGVIRIN